jgi:site-specific DNA recombinase
MHLSNESLLVIVIVGIVAGWLAGNIVRGGGYGLIGDLIVGVIGAFIGDWLLPQLRSHADERQEHEEAIKRHQVEYTRLNDRIHAMYVDKLDGLVDTAFYEKMSNQWREEQSRCQREIERHRNADKSYLDEGVALLDLARNAQRLFAKQGPREKRRLLNFVLSNCTWEDGEVVATFRQPFDMLAETATAAARVEAGERAKPAKSNIWLGDLDSNQD